MYAGDCDAPIYGKHNYSIDPTMSITFYDSRDTSSISRVPNAFLIVPITGDVSTNLPDYRKYSFGFFLMNITATDDMRRTANATLKVWPILVIFSIHFAVFYLFYLPVIIIQIKSIFVYLMLKRTTTVIGAKVVYRTIHGGQCYTI